MTTLKIPEKEIITCDRCGEHGERGINGAFECGGFHIRDSEQWTGNGGIRRNIDLCSFCCHLFFNAFMKVDKDGADT